MPNTTEESDFRNTIASYIKLHVGVVCHEWIISEKNRITQADNFSCVFIQNENKHYAVTASHNLENLNRSSRIIISSFNDKGPGKIIPIDFDNNPNFGLHKNKKIDLCFLEISQRISNSLKINFINSVNCSSNNCSAGTSICMIGFPTEFVERTTITNNGNKKHSFSAKPFILWSSISENIPEHNSLLSPKPDLNYDIYIEYNPDRIFDVNTDQKIQNIDPIGMSGCGIFSIPEYQNGEVWNASNINLIGIQSSYYKNSNLLKITKIDYLFDILNKR